MSKLTLILQTLNYRVTSLWEVLEKCLFLGAAFIEKTFAESLGDGEKMKHEPNAFLPVEIGSDFTHDTIT